MGGLWQRPDTAAFPATTLLGTAVLDRPRSLTADGTGAPTTQPGEWLGTTCE